MQEYGATRYKNTGPDVQVYGTVHSSIRYQFKYTGQRRDVDPSSEFGTRVLEFFRLLLATINAHPAYNRSSFCLCLFVLVLKQTGSTHPISTKRDSFGRELAKVETTASSVNQQGFVASFGRYNCKPRMAKATPKQKKHLLADLLVK